MLKVLIVDDEAVVRRGIVLGIDWASLGCAVVGEAANGEEGLAAAERYSPNLIITDVRMPHMDGIEMMRVLRERGSTAHVIVLTAYNDFDYARSALRFGAADYLLKPFRDQELVAAIERVREKEELRKVGNMGLLESMVADVSVQAVPPTMLVRCRGREFSVPRRCIGRRVKVLAMPSGQVRVEMAGETVAVHDLSAPGGPVVYDPAHYAEALAAKARYADADIEAAARANLELLGRLGEGSL